MKPRKFIFKLSSVETLEVTDRYNKLPKHIALRATIHTNNNTDLYRIAFINRLRKYTYFSDWIINNGWVECYIDRKNLEQSNKISDVEIIITKNDKFYKKLIYTLPRFEEVTVTDGYDIFNKINKEPIFICGSPGGGTSYIAKMIQYCGLYIGDVCRFEDRKTFEPTSIGNLQFYFVRQLLGDKSFKDAMSIYKNERTEQWLVDGKKRIDDNSDTFKLFKEEFINNLSLFWHDTNLNSKWGFKKPFNMIWINYLITLFPNAKVLIVDKQKSGKMDGRSFEGSRFEQMKSNTYNLFTDIGNELKCNNKKLDFYKMNTDINHFNDIMEWCGLPTKTEDEHYQMLKDLKYDNLKPRLKKVIK